MLAIDAGTGSGRAVAFDRSGAQLACVRRGWSASSPPELAPLGREYEPEALLTAVFSAAREVVERVSSERIAAVTVTGQRIGCVFEGADGGAAYAGPNGDVRAMLGADLSGLDPDALYRTTGRFPPWIFAPARLRWMAANGVPVTRVRTLPGWIASHLGASHTTSPSLAADLMLLDVARRVRAPADESVRWPEVQEPGAIVGELSEVGAATLGVRQSCPIVLAPADTQAALLGAGVLDAGDCVVAGGSAPLCRVMTEPRVDPRGRLWLDPHVRGDRWLLEANLGEMGTSHAWTAELILGARDFERFDALAAEAELGCGGASAHLGPRAMDLRDLNTARPAALLLPFGQTTGQAPPGRPQVLRAALESCAYAIRAGRGWLDAVEPRPDGPFTIAGGMARSEALCAMLASVLATPVVAAAPEASARGAAMCASLALGWAPDLESSVRVMRGPTRGFEPDEDDAEDYDEAFERWEEREAALERF